MIEKPPIDQINDLPSLFEKIRKRPPMYLGSTEASALKNVLSGIFLAEYVHKIPKDRCLGGFSFTDFEAWVEEVHNPKLLSLDSFSLACIVTTTEEEAFWKWFEWYDTFREKLND